MKIILCLCLVIAFFSCNQPNSKKGAEQEPVVDSIKQEIVHFTSPIISERINGPANVRDTINGKILFSLNDKTPVTCTILQNGWYAVGVDMDIANNEFGKDTLQKGRKIIVNGQEVGEILSPIPVGTFSDNKTSHAELIGYTQRDNIYSVTIIENVLASYLDTATDRSLQSLKPLLDNFKLQEEPHFNPFVSYYNYENWIDDPSPMYRILMVFDSGKLIGVIHSRPLHLANTTEVKLEKGFGAAFYNDTKEETRNKFVKAFNDFVKEAD